MLWVVSGMTVPAYFKELVSFMDELFLRLDTHLNRALALLFFLAWMLVSAGLYHTYAPHQATSVYVPPIKDHIIRWNDRSKINRLLEKNR